MVDHSASLRMTVLGCVPFWVALFSTQQIMTPDKYLVIPTAVEGSPAIGSELSTWWG